MSDQRSHLPVVFSVTLMAVLGVSSIGPALPEVRRALGVSSEQIGLVITAFTLPGALLTPVLGVLADRLGRRRVLLPSLLLFAAAGASCALARDFEILLLLRLLQGTGGAALGALNVTLIGDLYQGERRAAVMGWNASVLSAGTAAYPAIGGALAHAAWYWPFALPALALPVAWLVARNLKPTERASETSLRDYFRGAGGRLRDPGTILLFGASFLTFVILYGMWLTSLPLYLDGELGAPARTIGLLLAGGSVVSGLTSVFLGKIVRVVAARWLIALAFVLYGATLLLVPLLPGLWSLLLPVALFGAAMGINVPSILLLLNERTPGAERAVVLSFNGMSLRLGQTVGPLLAGGLMASGYAASFWVGAGIGLFGALSIALLLPAAESG